MADLPSAPTKIRIRQVALCTNDIWPVEQRITQELKVAPVHRDLPAGLISIRNVVFAVGNTFLEVLEPGNPKAPSQKFLDKQGGPAGYMLILQVDDHAKARARCEALGVRVVHDMPEREYHDVVGAAIHLHPSDVGGTLTSLDWMKDPESWAWAGPAWSWHSRTDVVAGITAVTLSCADPDAVAGRFSKLLGRSVESDRSISLDDSRIRFAQAADGIRDRLTAIDMTATDRSRVGEVIVLANTKICLV